ncbi:hypothetical protein B0H10DRAFT_1772137 [Mycena sp. CBHHK59/15]|nr:hypothetical protein B0H10DRAFT_1772137 [Mycena sp. CBHHK59/15]
MDIELGIVACRQSRDLNDETLTQLLTASEDCTLGVDVALLSSDGVTHGAHSKNLELYSEGFPPASLAAAVHKLPGDLEIVQVTETSNVIALLLQYVHNQPQPDSTAFSFETLAGLAEAAEKYLVYPAIEVCKIRMEASIPGHPLEVFAYATRHGYPKLRDAAAPLTIGCPLAAVVTVLGDRPDVFVAWVRCQ